MEFDRAGSAQDRLTAIESELSLIKAFMNSDDATHLTDLLASERYRLIQSVERSLRAQFDQVQALLQLQPIVDRARAPLPALGGWALEAKSILQITHLLKKRKPKLVLETGSGASTIWLGYTCADIGARLITLEHDPYYAEKVRHQISEHALTTTVDCRLAPLSDIALQGHESQWYSRDSVVDLDNIDVLLVDGPPATTGPFSRYPALPVLQKQLSDTCVILLDDAQRPEEKKTFERWLELDEGFKPLDLGVSSLAIASR